MFNLRFKKLVAALLAVTVISFPFVTTGCSRTQEDDAVSSTETEVETTSVETSATVEETEAVVETDATVETEAIIYDYQEISREPLALPDGKYIGTIYSVSEDGKSMLVGLEEPITMSVEEARTYEVGDEIVLPLRDGEMTCTVESVDEYDYPQLSLDAYVFYFAYNPDYDCMVLYDGNWIVGSDVSYEGVLTTDGDYMLYDYLSHAYSDGSEDLNFDGFMVSDFKGMQKWDVAEADSTLVDGWYYRVSNYAVFGYFNCLDVQDGAVTKMVTRGFGS